jgi:hypothetical protein
LVCDNAWTVNECEIAHAAARRAATDGIAEALKTNGEPYCDGYASGLRPLTYICEGYLIDEGGRDAVTGGVGDGISLPVRRAARDEAWRTGARTIPARGWFPKMLGAMITFR